MENNSFSITHYKHPTKFQGVFWMPSNKVYIYCLVKKYSILHDYVKKHEKKHYKNYNSGKYWVIRILLDILNEWNGELKRNTYRELLNDFQNYQIDLSNKNCIIKTPNKLMKKLGENEPNRRMNIYAITVGKFRDLPYIIPFLMVIAFMVDWKHDTLTRKKIIFARAI